MSRSTHWKLRSHATRRACQILRHVSSVEITHEHEERDDGDLYGKKGNHGNRAELQSATQVRHPRTTRPQRTTMTAKSASPPTTSLFVIDQPSLSGSPPGLFSRSEPPRARFPCFRFDRGVAGVTSESPSLGGCERSKSDESEAPAWSPTGAYVPFVCSRGVA